MSQLARPPQRRDVLARMRPSAQAVRLADDPLMALRAHRRNFAFRNADMAVIAAD